MNGNWATVYMTQDLGASATIASLALTAFWGMVTVGRILFAAIERWLPERNAYRILPFVAAARAGRDVAAVRGHGHGGDRGVRARRPRLLRPAAR